MEGTSRELVEVGRTVGLPQESGASGSAIAPKMSMGVGGFAVVPQESRGVSPSTQEQGAGSKRPRPDEVDQRSGGSPPKRICRPMALR